MQTVYEACRYQGKPAVFDRVTRVFYYGFKTMRAAKTRADSLNRGE